MRRFLPLTAILLLGGCAGSGASHTGEDYVVKGSRTLFYKYGPAQANGADLALAKGQRVRMLNRSYGYSSVLLESGQAGYIATEDLAPAPPEPKSGAEEPGGRPRGHFRRPTAEEEALVPPPDLPRPASEPPTFRY